MIALLRIVRGLALGSLMELSGANQLRRYLFNTGSRCQSLSGMGSTIVLFYGVAFRRVAQSETSHLPQTPPE